MWPFRKKEIYKKVYCEDCSFYKKGVSTYWDYCLHPKAIFESKSRDIRRADIKNATYSCDYMREWKCFNGKYFEPKEEK